MRQRPDGAAVGVQMASRRRFLDGMFVAVAVCVLALGVAFRLGDLRAQTVLSGSMQPVMSPGDVAITAPVPVTSLHIGDAIAFVPPGQNTPVLHRIVTLDGARITTKGDANRVVDPWKATLVGTTAYRLIFVVPFVGWLSEVRGPALIAAGLIVLLLIIVEIRKEVLKERSPRTAS